MHVYGLLREYVYNFPLLNVFSLGIAMTYFVGFIDLLVFLFMQYNMIAVTHLNFGCVPSESNRVSRTL